MTVSCPMCDRKSLLIYPVRYAIACPRGAANAPPLSGNFRIDPRAPQSVGSAKYTLRALRPGYLYTYDEKRQRLRAYMVFEDGVMWSFPPGTTPPPTGAEQLMTQGCAQTGDLSFDSLGRCVDVEHTPGVDEATNFWIGWSNVQWTKRLVDQVQDGAWRKLHMQCINIPAMLAGTATDTGEFRASTSSVAHFAMDEKSMKDAFDFSNQPPDKEIRVSLRHLPIRIGDAMARSPLEKGFIAAVNDPVGLTNDLGELTVPNLNNGFDEQVYWKWMSAQMLERAEAGIRGRAREMTAMSYGVSGVIADANATNSRVGVEGMPDAMGMFRVLYSAFKKGSLDAAVKEEDQNINDVPAAQKKAEDAAWEDASTKIDDKKDPPQRISVLDDNAYNAFKAAYPNDLKAFEPKWLPLVEAHAAWVNSQLLAEWMAGISDDRDLSSGYAYSESCAQALGKGVGTTACTKVLDDWFNSFPTSNIRNVYGKALMFNQAALIKAADAQVHGSDIQYENFLNIYKEAFKQVNKKAAPALRDRLVVTSGNYIVATLAKGMRGAAWGYSMIRLSLLAGVRVSASEVNIVKLRNLILDEGKAAGVDLGGTNKKKRATAMQAARGVLKRDPPSDRTTLAYQVDVDELIKSGKLDSENVQAIKIAGVETTKRWLGSSVSSDFHLGVATVIFQLATLAFAGKDLVGSDQFSEKDNLNKFGACFVALLGTLVQTVSETVHKSPTHPLGEFILHQWSGARRWAKVGVIAGRLAGLMTGLYLAGVDLLRNAPEAFRNKQWGLGTLYGVSGVLSAYIAVGAFVDVLPGFWIVLIASILIAITIAVLKAAALNDWISRCRFGIGEKYLTMDAELSAFNSAMGD